MESEQNKMLQKHEQDLYRGNGKPGLTTRMALVEDNVAKIEDSVDTINQTIEKNGKKTDRLSWLVAIGIGIVITLQFVFLAMVKK